MQDLVFLLESLQKQPVAEQEDLLLHETLTPGYYTIPKDIYQKYESMTLNLDYSWQGEMMSTRVIDLFTHEDLVPAYPSKSK